MEYLSKGKFDTKCILVNNGIYSIPSSPMASSFMICVTYKYTQLYKHPMACTALLLISEVK